MRARLTLETGEAKPAILDLNPEQPITLGRSRDNNVLLRDEHASRLHARIYFHETTWRIQDFGLNGTRIDGQRLQQDAPLEHNQEIRIGEIRFRFTLLDATPASGISRLSRTLANTLTERRTVSDSMVALSSTRLELDELTTLCKFMAGAVEKHEPHELIREALQILLIHTGADIVGYLGLESSDPTQKMVLPESAAVDVALSRQLTRRVQREGKPVWLGRDLLDQVKPGESLAAIQDAICLPLKAGSRTLGAIHLIRPRSVFTERAFRFAEVLTSFLAQSLYSLRDRRKLLAENHRLRLKAPQADDLVGDSPLMMKLRYQMDQAASLQTPLLILGEPGTGKQLVARLIHEHSSRADAPLQVTCTAAISPSILMAELVGYRPGAFTGADREYAGAIQRADEGTLFIDEISELPLDLQELLVKFLAGEGIQPLGGGFTLKPDVRLIAASTRNLEVELQEGRLLPELHQRLSDFTLVVPPLREHPDDIPYLTQYFLDQITIECRRTVTLTESAMKHLLRYPWPGNVRQLRAVLANAVLATESDVLDRDAFALGPNTTSTDRPPSLNLAQLQAWAVRQAYRQGGGIAAAAEILGLPEAAVREQLSRSGLITPMTE
ncbi:sigma 54-interacting transcriptional regulator [Tuwongella immobilis]|uniref:Sigma-54 factor interaction domain-containing protein n=1 Tax=Tuwongella immobilis TaxID=692036 RepID=A0A6C2YXY1_9BACT|nr:sigma 54-interacting transcriptional regulator [Tuwongella immobilis]VIP05615.1 two sigma54 fis family transcriptional regulator : Sigma54 specific transcriptional regulator, Fis family OS=Pirellula staleyi (strain ATCC 27377 / DSM 6068 / ICPB 4128) GN=Psta_4161 PE=4 SV=1: FHA: GAF: Sigma54_activat [Tuwongella immobilis]VTS08586.1 two sigma54 fis family transcriptional regulator : Sigma54 specific transcriptional regulator, Fis family OS=Pirellula staleyi (strain ATCC 27377 / DSM 6068 / ICPB 4